MTVNAIKWNEFFNFLHTSRTTEQRGSSVIGSSDYINKEVYIPFMKDRFVEEAPSVIVTVIGSEFSDTFCVTTRNVTVYGFNALVYR